MAEGARAVEETEWAARLAGPTVGFLLLPPGVLSWVARLPIREGWQVTPGVSVVGTAGCSLGYLALGASLVAVVPPSLS